MAMGVFLNDVCAIKFFNFKTTLIYFSKKPFNIAFKSFNRQQRLTISQHLID